MKGKGTRQGSQGSAEVLWESSWISERGRPGADTGGNDLDGVTSLLQVFGAPGIDEQRSEFLHSCDMPGRPWGSSHETIMRESVTKVKTKNAFFA